MKKLHFIIGLLLLVTLQAYGQFIIPPKPVDNLQTSLYDYASLLDQSQRVSLESKLLRYADSTSTQIVVFIVKSTKGDDISMVSTQWGQKWGIGQEKEDNGIVILLAVEDRKVDISTGYGIEYRMTDLLSERIINGVMIPQFKAGNYYAGLNDGVDAIFKVLMGEFTESRDFTKEDFPWSSLIIFGVFLFFIILSASKNNRNNGGRGGGNPSLLDIIILSNMGRGSMGGGFGGGGFGGGSSGGGGFGGGFGGGGFGGGGASGGW
ncbi:TPM domain-containing protein [Nonlabens mediterrranea]|uniref:TPM domain-containing protein n=1 Tax=Nonlabens mediterrranea TaxID=1419947 RepID=A0ABS0A8E4_9FLAO|nr:TPM domain-containing protein [Nonlabens mediterrranea]